MALERPEKLVYEATFDEELFRRVTSNADLDRYNLYQWDGLLTPELIFGGQSNDIDDLVRVSAKEKLALKVARVETRQNLYSIFLSRGGINLCHQLNPRHQTYPGIRVWRTYDGTREPIATDLLVTGAGVLHPTRVEKRTAYEKAKNKLCGDPNAYPDIVPVKRSKMSSILATHIVAYELNLGSEIERVSIQYHSTNRVYGDAYGEIEQLWRRRDDINFLERYLHDLQDTWHNMLNDIPVAVIPGYGEKALARLQQLVSALHGGTITRHLEFPISGYKKTKNGRLVHDTEKEGNYAISDIELCGFTHFFDDLDATFWLEISDIGSLPRGFTLYLQHLLEFGIWHQPPSTIQELRLRVELLLGAIEVD